MKIRRVIYISLPLLLAFTYGCLNSETQGETPEGKAIITDNTGRQWDVIHARDQYAMNPDFFNFGLGVGAISSVDSPTILERGDPGYSAIPESTDVFGVNHNGEQRAYSKNVLSWHEVFNDIYPGESNQYLAIAYCPLADLAVVYSRQIDRNILTLAPSGWTYGENQYHSTFVLIDKESESLWFPAGEQGCALPIAPLGESGCGLVGISGVYTDEILSGEFLSATTWAEWKKAFPDSKFVTD